MHGINRLVICSFVPSFLDLDIVISVVHGLYLLANDDLQKTNNLRCYVNLSS